MLMQWAGFILLGYILGSTMFGYLIPKIFCKIDVRQLSSDGNPGTANAFYYGGAKCGITVLLCDLLKGSLPVYFASRMLGTDSLWFALVMAAPVFGHAFPLKGGRKNGGKGIATTFGVMLGLYPEFTNLALLIFWYILFTLVIIIKPHSFRTAITYGCWLLSGVFMKLSPAIFIGNLFISCIVFNKHLEDLRTKKDRQVRLGFRRN